MKPELGKFYKTRDGQAVGPLVLGDDSGYPFEASALRQDGSTMTASWSLDGRFLSRSTNHRLDIVDELWKSDSPVRQVTKLEIVPGQYGRVKISQSGFIGLTNCNTSHFTQMTPEELRATAKTFNEIADALEDKT